MSSTPAMTLQAAHALLKQLTEAKDGDELQKIISENIMWCDGVFFSELDLLTTEFKRRGDESSAAKLKEVGDYMARLRFMI
ncbi:MAG TPA: hypothetical protein G4N96_14705 [Chloroflexi bacterium]|nr:hypothetical protein [Chloroflexota bacterium]